MNCRPCLYVYLIFGGAFLLIGLLIFSLGFIKLVIRVPPPKENNELVRPINSGGILNEFFNENAFFILVCGLATVLLAVFLLVPGWACLRRSERLKKRRQAKKDAEAGAGEEVEHSPDHAKTTVVIEAHDARSTDPLLSSSVGVAVETSSKGYVASTVPEEDDEFAHEQQPLTEKDHFEASSHSRSYPSDGHPVYDVPEVDESHENPAYHMRQEEHLHHHGVIEPVGYQGYQSHSGGLGPVAPVPALAVHRVVEEDEGGEDEEEGEEDNTAADNEDPPFANEGYVYASVKRTDRHSRSPSDESAKDVGTEGAPSQEGRSALLQKAHDLVDEVIRAASVDNPQPMAPPNFTVEARTEDLYDTCDSPIPSVHEDEEEEEEADHRSVTSSEEGVACFNAPTPEATAPVFANAIQEVPQAEEEEEEEDDDEDEAIDVEQEMDLLADVSAPSPPPAIPEIHMHMAQEEERVEEEEEEEDEGVAEDLMCPGEPENPPHEEEELVEEEEEDHGNDLNGNEAEPAPEVMAPPPADLGDDFGFELPPVAPEDAKEVEQEEEEEEEEEEEDHSQMFVPPQEEQEAVAEEDMNANMSAGMVHISPEDDVEIGELLDPRLLQPQPSSEGEEVLEQEEEAPTADSPPPPPPPPEPILDFEEPPYKEAEYAAAAAAAAEEEEDKIDEVEEEAFPAPEPQPSLLEDLGLMDSPAKAPPAPSDGFAADLVSFDEPEASYTPPPPPPPPPPPHDDEEGPMDNWNSNI